MGKNEQVWATRACRGQSLPRRALTAVWSCHGHVGWLTYEDWCQSFPFHVSSSHFCNIRVFTGGRHVSRKVSPPDDMRLLGAQVVPPINAWPNSSYLMGEWRENRNDAKLSRDRPNW